MAAIAPPDRPTITAGARRTGPARRIASGFLALVARRDRFRDPSLTALLVVQCFTLFAVVPLSSAGWRLPAVLSLGALFVLMSLVIFMARGRWTMFASAAMLLLSGISRLVEHHVPGDATRIAGELVSLSSFTLLGFVVFRAIFGPGRVTGHRILGAIVLYLNVGLMFALMHRLVAEFFPGAYHGLPPSADGFGFRAATDYFSFATLTSLGYGDVVPVHPVARSLATLEAIFGQLYPPIFLARLVMLELHGQTVGETGNPTLDQRAGIDVGRDAATSLEPMSRPNARAQAGVGARVGARAETGAGGGTGTGAIPSPD